MEWSSLMLYGTSRDNLRRNIWSFSEDLVQNTSFICISGLGIHGYCPRCFINSPKCKNKNLELWCHGELEQKPKSDTLSKSKKSNGVRKIHRCQISAVDFSWPVRSGRNVCSYWFIEFCFMYLSSVMGEISCRSTVRLAWCVHFSILLLFLAFVF